MSTRQAQKQRVRINLEHYISEFAEDHGLDPDTVSIGGIEGETDEPFVTIEGAVADDLPLRP